MGALRMGCGDISSFVICISHYSFLTSHLKQKYYEQQKSIEKA